MCFNARERERELVLFVMARERRVGQQLRRRALPSAPDFRGGKPHRRIVAGQSAIVSGKQIAALGLGDVGDVGLPRVGIDNGRTALIKPVDLLLAEQKYAS